MLDPNSYSTEELGKDNLTLQRRLEILELQMSYVNTLFPKRARRHVKEGHIHDVVEHIVAGSGAGGITHYDYNIDSNFSGTEGTVVTNAGGSTTRMYTTLALAVTHANSNRQTAGLDTTFYISGGDYTIATEIDCNIPEQSWWHFIGEGKDKVTLTGTMVTGNMIGLNANTLSGRASFADMTLATTEPIDLIDATLFGFLQVRNCRLVPNDPGAVGIRPGRSSAGGLDPSLSVTMTEFIGVSNGWGILTPGGTDFASGWHITNCEFDGLEIGIQIDNVHALYIANTRFACATNDFKVIGPSQSLDVSLVNCEFTASTGILIAGPTGAAIGGLSVEGCHFVDSGLDIDQAMTIASNCENWTIIGNVFRNGGIGIRGINAANGGPRYSTIIGNTFEGFTSGNEIRFCTHATQNIGNVVVHNTTDSGAILPEMGAGHNLIQDEGVALTQRTSMDVISAYMQAIDDAAAAVTRIRQGWIAQEAVVDSDQHVILASGTAGAGTSDTQIVVSPSPAWAVNNFARAQVIIYTSGGVLRGVRDITSNTADTLVFASLTGVVSTDTFIVQPGIRVYRRLAEAIAGGHRSISYRASSGETALTIGSGDSVAYILGDSPTSATIAVNVTNNKTQLVFDSITFSGSVITLAATGSVLLGCRITGQSRVDISGADCALIASTFILAGISGSNLVNLNGNRPRMLACAFASSASNSVSLIAGNSSGGSYSITGCSSDGTGGTGYMIDMVGAGGGINGCVLGMPTTATGCLRAPALTNVSGNIINIPVTTSGTLVGISAGTRCVVTGNLFRGGGTLTGTVTQKAIEVTGAGTIVTGNSIFLSGINSANATFKGIEITAGFEGTNIANNLFLMNTFIAGTVIGIDPLDNVSARLVLLGNIWIGATVASSPHPWQPLTRLDEQMAHGLNLGLPIWQVYKYDQTEDFDRVIDGAVGAASPHQLNGFTIAYSTVADSQPANQGGITRLETGAGIGQDAVIWKPVDTVGAQNEQPLFECLFEINDVASVVMFCGLSPAANWGLGMARPAAGIFLELDTAIDANFRFVITNGGVASVNQSLGAAAVGIHRFSFYRDRANRHKIYFDGVLTALTAASTTPAVAMTPGAYIEALNAANKILDIDMFRWGSLRE